MTRRISRLGFVIALAAGTALIPGHASALPANAPKLGMVCTPGTLAGTTRTFNLVANTGDIQTPDGNSVFMWSYANGDAPDSGKFQSPGPVLCANQGETVVVNLSNTLPEPSSIVFPGQDSAVTATGGAPGPFTREAATNGTVRYSFTAGSPGTYRYESGSDPAKQIEMGLYGALIVRPASCAACAYGPTTRFDPVREFLLLLAEIDPDLHHAVETGGTYDANALHNRYFTINGRSFPDTIQDNGSVLLPTQPYGALVRIQPNTPTSAPALLRMINAGLDNHPFHPHGNHTREIAQDGRLLLAPNGAAASTEHFGETVGAGQTIDYLLRWDNQAVDSSGASFNDDWNAATNPLPVAQPNYRNLTFKDGNTFYGGSPYLGTKGTLPTGTVQQNVCGEWYFPLHSHALNEFSNFDEGFGGMGTLLRVDPFAGCTGFVGSSNLVGGTLKSGSVTALAADDANYYQVNPKPVTALAIDWYAGFTGVAAGSQNLRITYKGKNCATTTATTCTALTTDLPQQTVKVCDWTIGGAAGCSTATSSGWVTLPPPPAQPQGVGSTEVGSTWTLPGSADRYIGTGANTGQVRVLIHTQRSTGSAFSTWANLLTIRYDAP